MASSNISKKEVRKKLEESLKNFDWLNEFFPHSNKFILEYKLYHAQLREGDKLEINVSKSENSKNGIPYAEPFLEIILHSKENRLGVVCTFYYDGSLLRGSELLYKN